MITREKLAVLQELMDELTEEMGETPDDLGERLGRKPKVEMMSIEAKEPMDMDDEMSMDDEMVCDEEMGEESDLKKRLMGLRKM